MKWQHRRLDTERLTIATIPPGRARQVADFYRRNREFHRPWEPLRDESYYNPEFHRQVLKGQARDSGALYFWIYLKTDGDEERIIGSVSFSNIIRGFFQSCFVGYKMDQFEVNKGYTTEALSRCVDHVFAQDGLHRLEANIMPANGASLRVAEKCGFAAEGLARNYLRIQGRWEDHFHMVRLRPDNV
jgi:ribosomal-protein-alanine N-acetyltransferase